jgi:hypothetical protein
LAPIPEIWRAMMLTGGHHVNHSTRIPIPELHFMYVKSHPDEHFGEHHRDISTSFGILRFKNGIA